ncbi:MAG TPA: hypothetical protein PKX92_03045 [Edaphocola sp.]|nr:hypothetical protein [Edaphocola sp.]
MSEEIKRIKNNNIGQTPRGLKTIIEVSGIPDAKAKLENIKAILSIFIENKDLDNTDPQWEILLPEKFVKFIKLLDEKDYDNDHYLQPLKMIIYDLKNRPWEWYSSKLNTDGFKIVMQGTFYPIHTWLIHCQNIPLKNIQIHCDRFESYGLETINDVTSYKKFE